MRVLRLILASTLGTAFPIPKEQAQSRWPTSPYMRKSPWIWGYVRALWGGEAPGLPEELAEVRASVRPSSLLWR